jgi:hypothetical protein
MLGFISPSQLKCGCVFYFKMQGSHGESTSACPKNVISGGLFPVWSPDGKQIFYIQNRGAIGDILAIDVQTKPTFTFGKPVALPVKNIIISGGQSIPRGYDISPGWQAIRRDGVNHRGRSAKATGLHHPALVRRFEATHRNQLKVHGDRFSAVTGRFVGRGFSALPSTSDSGQRPAMITSATGVGSKMAGIPSKRGRHARG